MPVQHIDATTIHLGAYVQSADPGAIGAKKLWVDTSAGPPYQLKKRNDANTGWDLIGSVVTDHGALAGLGDDDHPHYHNDARGDARYAALLHTHDEDDLNIANLDVTGEYRVDGVKVLGDQGAAVADATDAASAITQLNLLLARVRAHGIIAT